MAFGHLIFFFFEQSGTPVPDTGEDSFDGQYMGPGVLAFFDGYSPSEAPEPVPEGPRGGWLPEDIEEQQRQARRHPSQARIKERERERRANIRAFMERVADGIFGTEAEPEALETLRPFVVEEAQPLPELPTLPALDLEALADSAEALQRLDTLLVRRAEAVLRAKQEEEAVIVLLMD